MNQQITSLAPILPLLLGLLSQCGCVALNVPSERIADPTDNGGLFGHWRGSQGYHPGYPHSMAMPSEGTCVASDCWDGGSLEMDSCEAWDSCESCDQPKSPPPEVPWPRFLPVPTRPVFGSAASQSMFAR